MLKFLLFISLSYACPKTEIVNHTKVWNKVDEDTLNFTSKRCKIYYKKSQCLKKFVKMEENVYRATCGRPNG